MGGFFGLWGLTWIGGSSGSAETPTPTPPEGSVTVQAWKSVMPNRKDIASLERSIKTLDRALAVQNEAIINDITNIVVGTTPVPFTWQEYTGP